MDDYSMDESQSWRSQELTLRARSIAEVYGAYPEVAAVILGGSTARGTAGESSDIDIGVFWQRLPDEATTISLLQQAGIRLNRSVANEMRFSEGCPRRNGRIEIGHLSAENGFQCCVDVEHETVEGTEEVLDRVFTRHEVNLENQELVSVIRQGVVLHGEVLLQDWRKISEAYPDAVAHRIIQENLGGISSILGSIHHVTTSYEMVRWQRMAYDLRKRITLALMAANRIWAFTDNTDFKGLDSFVCGVSLKPPMFLRRLRLALASTDAARVQVWVSLIRDLVVLISKSDSAIDLSGELEALNALQFSPDTGTRLPDDVCNPQINGISTEVWEKDHTRWGQLEICVGEMGQTGWFRTCCDFHLYEKVLVAHAPEAVVGFLRLVIQEIGADEGLPSRKMGNEVLREGKILAFGVSPAFRQSGVGTALLDRACLIGRCESLFQLRAHSSGENAAAHRVLMNIGFGNHPIERRGDTEGGYFIKPLRDNAWAEQSHAADADKPRR